MQKVGEWKVLPRQQISDDLLWGMNKNYNCFLRKSHSLSLSMDPTNISGLNLKRDSGISSQEGIGITTQVKERKVKERKAKKNARVIRYSLNLRSRRQLGKNRLVALKANPTSNNSAYSTQDGLTSRSIVKILRRGLKNYRPDLIPLAFRKLRRMHKSKKINKKLNRKEARKAKN